MSYALPNERTFGDGPTSQHTTTPAAIAAADAAATTDNTNEDTPTYLQNSTTTPPHPPTSNPPPTPSPLDGSPGRVRECIDGQFAALSTTAPDPTSSHLDIVFPSESVDVTSLTPHIEQARGLVEALTYALQPKNCMFILNRIIGRRGLLVGGRLLRPFVGSFSKVASPPSSPINLRDDNINHIFGAYEEVLSMQIHYLRHGRGASNILLFPGPFGSIRTDYMDFLRRLNINEYVPWGCLALCVLTN
nr:unnamed protein product [Spirometra erinaceieuropaei]